MLGFILLLTLVSLASSANPGVKLRVTQNGINYASTVAQAALAKELKSLHLGDQHGKDGHISWDLTHIENKGVTPPTVKITFDPKHNAVALALAGLSIHLKSDWRIKYKKGWIKASTSGSVDVKVKSVSVTVSVSLGVGKDGRPSLKTASCRANIGGVDLDFHGGTGWIINLFKHPLERKVRDLLQGQICKIVEKAVNVDGNKALSKLKVTVEMDHRFILDYSLSAAPVVTSTYLDVLDKGEVYWKTDKKEAPFSPKPIPPQSDVKRMLYLWITEYTADTALYVGQNHDYLKLNVTKKDLPGKNSTYLDTTCKLLCIGKLIPQIGKMFPNRVVKMVVKSTAVPQFSITPKGITLGLTANTDMYAEAPGKDPAYLLTLNINMSLSVKGQIVKERLVGKITGHSFHLSLVKSAVGKVSVIALNGIIGGALSLVVIPELNRIAEKGVDLPMSGNVKFSNTSLNLLQGSLMVATDLVYKPGNEAQVHQAGSQDMPRVHLEDWDEVDNQLNRLPQEPVFKFIQG